MLPLGHSLQNGKYKIQKVLGQGGFGITYLAQHILFGEVVVKELFLQGYCQRNPADFTVKATMQDAYFQQFKDRFLEEARVLVRFKGKEGIVQAFDFFEENGTAYFAMEYVFALSLGDLIAKQKAPLSENEALYYIRQCSEALAWVHKNGILHRDIKPQNILITEEGKAILIDFGISREFSEGQTAFHTVMFTPAYSAPEQMTESDKRGHYTDIYSLGATLYYCLTGKMPQVLGDIALNGFTPAKEFAPHISAQTNAAITKAMQLKREMRFANVEEWLSALPRPQEEFCPNPVLFEELKKEATQAQNVSPNPPTPPPPPTSFKPQTFVQQTVKNKNKVDTLAARLGRIVGFVVVLGVLFGGLHYLFSGKSKREIKPKRKYESVKIEQSDFPLETEFVKNAQSEGMTGEWQEAMFNKYPDSYSALIKGYIKIEKMELSALQLKMQFLNENEEVVFTDMYDALSDSDPQHRSGDLLPIRYLQYQGDSVIAKPWKKVKIEVSHAEKNAAPATFKASPEIPLKWLNTPNENVKLTLRERYSQFSASFNKKETHHRVTWEVENTGNTAIKLLKLQVSYLDKGGSVVNQRFTYALASDAPTLSPGQHVLVGGVFGAKCALNTIGKYTVEVLEWQ